MKVFRVFHGGGVLAYQSRDVELSRQGHEVTLMVPSEFRELPTLTKAVHRSDDIEVIPVRLYGLRRNPFFFYGPLSTSRIIQRVSPDIIDLHEEPYSLAAASVLLARSIARSKSRIIFRSSQNEYKKYPIPFSWIQKIVLRSSSAAYVPSALAKQVLERKGYRKKVSVIGNGVELPEAKVPVQSSDGPVRVLYVGRLLERKGVEELVRAVLALKNVVHLTLVGSGPMEDQLRSIVDADENSARHVKFVGVVPHETVIQWMRQSDVICVPSRELPGWSEQFSRALVEGMANYCVPLVSTSGALGEVSGEITPTFNWGETDDLILKLRELASHESLDRLKEQANQQAQKYSWRKTSEQIAAIYEEVMR